MTGLYYYGARYYDASVWLFLGVDPMAEKHNWLSPYSYCRLNPINRIDPDGALDDGYQDLEGNYKWYDDETADVVYKDDKFWLKVTDDKGIFNVMSTGIFDNLPEAKDLGLIKEADNLSSFEMWLDSPSESYGEVVGKIGANIMYSIVNSPYSLLTGKTIGGKSLLNSNEKMEAFIDVVPGLMSFGLTKSAQVIKTTQKGLNGFNQFVKRAPGITTTKGLPAGMKWQQRAGQLFQINKVNQQGLKNFGKGLKTTGVISATKKELEKNKK